MSQAWWVAAIVLVPIALASSQARADRCIPVSSDDLLLRADAIVVGTVSEIRVVRDDVLRVDLSDVDVITSRWRMADGVPFVFNARGYVGATAGSTWAAIGRLSQRLAVGHRYLILLEGGAWRHSPLVRCASAVYEIASSGDVHCSGGGHVYGIGPMGFICSDPVSTVSLPMTESAIATAIIDWIRVARLRHPDRAAAYDSSFEELELSPHHDRE